MMRTFLADVLAGLIFLALLGILAELLGPTMAGVVSAASIVGLLARLAWRQRRKLLNRVTVVGPPRPIGRVGRGRRIDSEA